MRREFTPSGDIYAVSKIDGMRARVLAQTKNTICVEVHGELQLWPAAELLRLEQNVVEVTDVTDERRDLPIERNRIEQVASVFRTFEHMMSNVGEAKSVAATLTLAYFQAEVAAWTSELAPTRFPIEREGI